MHSIRSSARVSRRFGTKLFAIVAVIAAQAAFFANDMINLRNALDRQRIADQALVAIRNLGTGLVDAETGQRGFLLSGDETYLKPYVIAQREARRTIAAALQATPPDELYTVGVTNGIGMSREFVPHAFDLFAQAAQSADRTQGGLGLGLALVKNLVELHGGHVECSSEGLGMGSQFTVRLPRPRHANE